MGNSWLDQTSSSQALRMPSKHILLICPQIKAVIPRCMQKKRRTLSIILWVHASPGVPQGTPEANFIHSQHIPIYFGKAILPINSYFYTILSYYISHTLSLCSLYCFTVSDTDDRRPIRIEPSSSLSALAIFRLCSGEFFPLFDSTTVKHISLWVLILSLLLPDMDRDKSTLPEIFMNVGGVPLYGTLIIIFFLMRMYDGSRVSLLSANCRIWF